jgi:hypothetical protein
LAFDVQAHGGLLQIVSGGAGTMGRGPLALMPSRSEYLHVVQMALDGIGLRYQVLNVSGKVRESLSWPFAPPASRDWPSLDRARGAMTLASQGGAGAVLTWRFLGRSVKVAPGTEPQTLLCGWDPMEGLPTVWVGFDGHPPRLTVRLVPQSGHGWQQWTGPVVAEDSPFDFQLALHPGMGPGGVLTRTDDASPWESLTSPSSKGAEDLTWPQNWAIGASQSGPGDWRYRGEDLRITWTRRKLPSLLERPAEVGLMGE